MLNTSRAAPAPPVLLHQPEQQSAPAVRRGVAALENRARPAAHARWAGKPASGRGSRQRTPRRSARRSA